jgi:hypothetical protein
MTAQLAGTATGTKNTDNNHLLWYVGLARARAAPGDLHQRRDPRERLSEFADLFRKAQADSSKGAEMGKQMLRSRLAS